MVKKTPRTQKRLAAAKSQREDWMRMRAAGYVTEHEVPSPSARALHERLGESLEGKSILDVGAGNLTDSFYLADQGAQVEAVELCLPADLAERRGKRKVKFTNQLLEHYKAAEGRFDGVLANHVLQYIHSDRLEIELGRLSRYLKPAGYLALAMEVEGGAPDRRRLPVPVYCHSAEHLAYLLSRGGVTVIEADFVDVTPPIVLPGSDPDSTVRAYQVVAQKV